MLVNNELFWVLGKMVSCYLVDMIAQQFFSLSLSTVMIKFLLQLYVRDAWSWFTTQRIRSVEECAPLSFAKPSGVSSKLVFICKVSRSLCGYHHRPLRASGEDRYVSHIKYSIISHYLKASDHLPDTALLQPD